MADSGELQFNDILLSIPPEQIITDRDSVSHYWKTLRTRSSMKLKSGFSTFQTVLKRIAFTDTVDQNGVSGYDKLRHIISQVRVTPFVWIDNDYLRSVILAGSKDQAMVFAVHSIEIIKANDNSNVIYADIFLEWFNYAPYLQNFTFKRDIWVPDQVKDPRNSRAWRRLYEAEQVRGNYNKKVSSLDGKLGLAFTQYSQLTIKDYQKLDAEVRALRKLEEEIRQKPLDGQDVAPAIVDSLANSLGGDRAHAATLAGEIFGDATSMGADDGNEELHKKVTSALSKTLKGEEGSRYDIIINADKWRITLLRNGKPISIKEVPWATKSADGRPQYNPNETIIVERVRDLNFDRSGLIVQGLSITFSNQLARIPLLGHPYPTFQYIGGADTVVELSMTTTKEAAVSAISNFHSVVEAQAHQFRIVPSGQRNVNITNDILNRICGLYEFIPEALSIQSVVGQPGTSNIFMRLVDNPLTSTTRENVAIGQSFTTSNDIRLKLAQILERNLALNQDAFEFEDPLFDSAAVRKKRDVPPRRGGRGPSILDPRRTKVWNVYDYTGSISSENTVFKNLCEEYGRELGKTLALLLESVQLHISRYQSQESGDLVTSLLVLNNNDLIGIEKLQDDLRPLLKKNAKVQEGLAAAMKATDTDSKLRNAMSTLEQAHALDAASTRESLSTVRPLVDLEAAAQERLNAQRGGLIEAHNTLEEIDSELVSSADSETLRLNAESAIADVRSKLNMDPRKVVIEAVLSEWVDFLVPFLDSITQKFLDLPQFESIVETLEKQSLDSASDCYPDFPLREVLTTLQQEGNPGVKSLTQVLKDTGAITKNINAFSLISPDFYMYTPQFDSLRELIPGNAVQKAITAIQSSQGQEMFKAEESWFDGIYRKQIMGEEKYVGSAALRNNKDVDKVFWAGNENKVRDDAAKIFAPNDLEGNLGSSISVAQAEGKSIVAPEVKPGKDRDKWYATAKSSKPTTLVAGGDVSKVQHRLGLHSIKFLPESQYSSLPPQDPDKRPTFIYPVGAGFTPPGPNRDFGDRVPPDTAGGKKGSAYHKGIDFAFGPGRTLGLPVYAATDGKVVRARRESAGDGYGNNIMLQHSKGFKTRYCHLVGDDIFERLYTAFHQEGEFAGASRALIDSTITVRKGDIIGSIGSTGNSSGPHLHFEMFEGDVQVDPIPLLEGFAEKSQGPVVGISPQNESILTKSIDQFTREMQSGQGGGLVRAYPTFKLYFIESDLGERKHFAFDDFFSYSAVQEISVVRNRKIAADLCVINLTNTSGVLSGRKFRNSNNEPPVEEPGSVNADRVNTANENPFAQLMLQSGTQVQLRLGYSNNPDDLDTVFNGVITDVMFTQGDNLVTIVCQTFAIELTQTVQGKAKEKEFGGWLSGTGRTGSILEELLASPEVVHFGRWEPGQDPSNTARGLLRNDWRRIPTPADDNIFAPGGGGGIFSIFDSSPQYIMFKTNTWEVFQEMTLRHPGFIASAVPYDGKYGPRMTMFFGVPDQLYFARDPTIKEDAVFFTVEQFLKGDLDRFDPRARVLDDLMDGSRPLRLTGEEVLAAEQAGALSIDEDRRKAWLKNVLTAIAKDKGIIRPFRSYHVITSQMHIVGNDVTSSANSTFNVMTVQYNKGEPKADQELGELVFDGADTFTLEVDGGIPDEDKREGFSGFPNCKGSEMAKRYALAMLWRSMKDGYRGAITILGNGKIKPYDICYVFDEYTDMFGPVEVEQVVHRFSQETGFVTEITPDMVIHVNQASTMASSDAMGLVVEHYLHNIGLPSLGTIYSNAGSVQKSGEAIVGAQNFKEFAGGIASMGLTLVDKAVLSPIASMFYSFTEDQPIGAFIWNKLTTRTQFAHPLRYSPLTVHGIALPGGVPVRRLDCGFIQSVSRWFKETSVSQGLFIRDLVDSMHPNEWFGRSQGDLFNTLVGRNR